MFLKVSQRGKNARDLIILPDFLSAKGGGQPVFVVKLVSEIAVNQKKGTRDRTF